MQLKVKMAYFTLGHRLPHWIASRLYGDRKKFGLKRIPDDPCWKEWETAYLDFYYNTQKKSVGAVVNVGQRPTFGGEDATTKVEVHLLDFAENLYGEYLEVHFLKAHRGEKKFASADALAAQIERDVGAFREFWAEERSGLL